VEIVEQDVRDTDGFASLIATHAPRAVHNLAALSSVGASWGQPDLFREVNAEAVIGMLAVLRTTSTAPVFVQASSSEIFGPAASGTTVDESTPLHPASPYAEAKAAAHRAIAAARSDGLPATNLILFGHTGPLHGAHFALPTLCRQAAEAAAGKRTSVELNDPTTTRDWGAATDTVRAFSTAASATAGDFVVATGRMHALAEVATWALDAAGRPELPVSATGMSRPNDFGRIAADAGRARAVLGWLPTTPLRQVIATMVAVERARIDRGLAEHPDYLHPERLEPAK